VTGSFTEVGTCRSAPAMPIALPFDLLIVTPKQSAGANPFHTTERP